MKPLVRCSPDAGISGRTPHPGAFPPEGTLKSQLNYWLDNYARAQDGDVISAALEKEVPDSTVTRDYLIYLDSPTRSS